MRDSASHFTAEPDADTVRECLERVVISREFAPAPRLAAFLRFIVEETMAGRRDSVKETTVAVHVFGRSSDFDPRFDSVVRAQGTQLRRRLQVEEYEKETPYDAAEWQPDAVRVRLKQHAGEPAVPVVEAGKRVKQGQIVGRVADGKLGAHVHASIDGKVRAVTADAVEIVA